MTAYSKLSNGTLIISDTGAQFNLATTTALSYTVPGTSQQKYKCIFSWGYNANVWVGYNVTATLPGTGAINSTYNIQLRPDEIEVKGGDVLSFISTAAVTDAGLNLYALNG
jgi:hypothetical protein